MIQSELRAVIVPNRKSLLLSANKVLSTLALLQPEEVSDRRLPLSVYVPFVQGFNGVYIFFQAVVESKAFLVPWTRSDREMELAQSV